MPFNLCRFFRSSVLGRREICKQSNLGGRGRTGQPPQTAPSLPLRKWYMFVCRECQTQYLYHPDRGFLSGLKMCDGVGKEDPSATLGISPAGSGVRKTAQDANTTAGEMPALRAQPRTTASRGRRGCTTDALNSLLFATIFKGSAGQ